MATSTRVHEYPTESCMLGAHGVCDAGDCPCNCHEPAAQPVCIEDFCGNWRGLSVSFSCDYFPDEHLLYFTGDWGGDIPTMPSDTEPTLEQAYAWARQHGGEW